MRVLRTRRAASSEPSRCNKISPCTDNAAMFARFVQHCLVDTRADIAIVGGGIMGSALAYWLTRLEPTASVVVVERDPGYTTASSALSAASIRQQFTTPVNIRISQSSIEFLRASGELLAVDEL